MALEDPLWIQALTYSGREDRTLIEAALTEGVIGRGDLAVSQRGAGANMSVDVAVGKAAITGDDVADQGRYLVRSTTVANVVIGAAPGANSRIDVVVLRIHDASATGVSNTPAFAVIPGVALAAPVAPAVPNGALELAHVLVVAGDVSVLNAKITDRRVRSVPAAGAGGELGYAQSVTVQPGITAVVDVTGGSKTVMVGAGRRIRISGQGGASSTVADDQAIGRIKEGATELGVWLYGRLPGNGSGSAILTPTAGAHTYKLTIERAAGTGTVTLGASATNPCFILVEDIGPA